MFSMFIYINIFFFLWFFLILKNKFYEDKNDKKKEIEIGVVLGSGGHTFEIIEILKILKNNDNIFNFFYASNDIFSKIKVEKILKNYKKKFLIIPRCRNVGESYILSFIKFFFTFIYCIFLTYKMNNMKLIIVNGPGTCLPVVFSLLFRKYIFFKTIKIVYIESVCRIYSLSLTAKLLYVFADLFVVFSEHLEKKYKKAKFYGYLF
ncbi:dolichol-linked oligosaccharide biosynthesis enzyme, putative [Plasmodium gallinaceum]|uniref:UDP-N-acetylglucosamine transferase subunit ALG14 n=1 Tax=Plasmodium gallinaceum TaxID=5849 RepID=A0A1J1GP98_PLAGA|nr:dolichol-linked oligosaccharide biosynthesis enzyme, putative [Plasmodium gallinaceum]CRG94319.1 dolichol-linked oligosaccharide biosynthesis enzyme, putative [Plasmodium gallinaceum]